MVPRSLDGACSDGGSQILWDDGERAFHRGWRPDDNGQRHPVLIVLAVKHPYRSSLDRLTHEYQLKDARCGAACKKARERRRPLHKAGHPAEGVAFRIAGVMRGL